MTPPLSSTSIPVKASCNGAPQPAHGLPRQLATPNHPPAAKGLLGHPRGLLLVISPVEIHAAGSSG
jgi:hypothetical protein